jgi:hypothetical protein
MQVCVDLTLGPGLCWERFLDNDFIGRRQLRMQQIWFKSAKIVKKCTKDQKQPSSLTQLIQPTWPLQRWGLNLLGPLPPAQGNLKYVIVVVGTPKLGYPLLLYKDEEPTQLSLSRVAEVPCVGPSAARPRHGRLLKAHGNTRLRHVDGPKDAT